MNKIIALRGIRNRGKTSTIKKVYRQLIEEYPNCQIECLKDGADIRAILTIDGIKIGLESQGDPKGRLLKSLDLFVKSECQIIICATRSSGGTVNKVNSLKGSYEILWLEQVEKSSETMREERDRAMAEEIICHTDSIRKARSDGETLQGKD